jgi:hypothetical protein
MLPRRDLRAAVLHGTVSDMDGTSWYQTAGDPMSPTTVFQVQLVLGYLPWLLFFGAHAWPRLAAMERRDAHRAIAMLHSFRFFGLVFIVPGVVGPALPAGFATFAAYGDFATGVLAMLALLSWRVRPLFWLWVIAFNLMGTADLLIDYYHGRHFALPPGQLGATYAIPVLVVPLLMITHVVAFYLLLHRRSATEKRSINGRAALAA